MRQIHTAPTLIVMGIAAVLIQGDALSATSGQSCDSLTTVAFPQTTITAAREIAPGAFIPGGAPNARSVAVYKALPAFCRVQGVIKPSSDSNIQFEVWLPLSGWNRRYLGVGNGGFLGSIVYLGRPESNAADLAHALASGYATSSTDVGHEAPATDTDWALGHPERVLDYDYRAIHETAVRSKTIVSAFYGNGPIKSYFNSCSNGGRQAFIEAQRYPTDYDGIVAGDPAYTSHNTAADIWNMQALMKDAATYIPERKLPAIQAATLKACDALDGVKDGIISEPLKCHFDPRSLLCKGADSDACLTQPQVDAVKKIYAGPRTSKGVQIAPGLLPGDEAGSRGWNFWITGSKPGTSAQYLYGVLGAANVLYQDPHWDFRTFNFDTDVTTLDAKSSDRNATSTDLRRFKDRGGKLIIYHGWADDSQPPLASVNYYQNVVVTMGSREVDEFMRLYMVPGMQHCGGGPGPDVIDALDNDSQHSVQKAVESWVEQGVPPGSIVAMKYKTTGHPTDGITRTRPICPYPQVQRYKGSGSIDEAASFICVKP